jgi:hypothetical protein
MQRNPCLFKHFGKERVHCWLEFGIAKYIGSKSDVLNVELI